MKGTLSRIGILYGLVVVLALLSFSGCARVGQEFNAKHVQEIKIGQTTKSDVLSIFGEPWRIGNENGVTMWTYGRYTYYLIGEADTKDLVIKFDDEDKVSSYTLNKTLNKKE